MLTNTTEVYNNFELWGEKEKAYHKGLAEFPGAEILHQLKK